MLKDYLGRSLKTYVIAGVCLGLSYYTMENLNTYVYKSLISLSVLTTIVTMLWVLELSNDKKNNNKYGDLLRDYILSKSECNRLEDLLNKSQLNTTKDCCDECLSLGEFVKSVKELKFGRKIINLCEKHYLETINTFVEVNNTELKTYSAVCEKEGKDYEYGITCLVVVANNEEDVISQLIEYYDDLKDTEAVRNELKEDYEIEEIKNVKSVTCIGTRWD